jgi:hypothetical protein
LLAAMALAGASACGQAKADVEPLPPLRRPTLEERAGLPRLAGRWLFTGFEYPARDTLRVREQVYRLVPPGEFAIATQRLDSVAGQYVRGGVAFPFTGEVRRDGIFSFVAMEAGGGGQFVAGHVIRDTLWIELTGFPSAAEWPRGARAALVRNPKGPPFVRLRGYVPPPPPPVDSTRPQDGQPAPPPPPPAPAPSGQVEPRPRPQPAPPPPPPPPPVPVEDTVVIPPPPIDTAPVVPPPPEQPRRRGRRGRDTAQVPPPAPPTFPQMPRDTIRFPPPPR